VSGLEEAACRRESIKCPVILTERGEEIGRSCCTECGQHSVHVCLFSLVSSEKQPLTTQWVIRKLRWHVITGERGYQVRNSDWTTLFFITWKCCIYYTVTICGKSGKLSYQKHTRAVSDICGFYIRTRRNNHATFLYLLFIDCRSYTTRSFMLCTPH
jgi:hypothetical protein